jgi:hypothetical protein
MHTRESLPEPHPYILRQRYMTEDMQLFVSLLTTTTSYLTTTTILLAISLLTLITEFYWIKVVYERFPILRAEADDKAAGLQREGNEEMYIRPETRVPRRPQGWGGVVEWIQREKSDWTEFARLPIFCSESASTVVTGCLYTLPARLDRHRLHLPDHAVIR